MAKAYFWDTYSEAYGKKTKLNDVMLVKEDRGYFLDVTYTVETDSEKSILHIPRVKIPIRTDHLQVLHVGDSLGGLCSVNLGFGALDVWADKESHFYTEKIIETKTHEMTLSEIEQKLGYKVKIVNR